MATKSQAQLELEKEVKKNLRRIKRFVKSAEKRGYSFSKTAIPTLPKTITEKTLKRYESIRPDVLYKKAVYVSPEGTKLKGYEARTQERKIAARKAVETRKKFLYEKKAKPTTKAPKQGDYIMLTIEDLMYHFTYGEQSQPSWSSELSNVKSKHIDIMRKALNRAIANDGKDKVVSRINTRINEIYQIMEMVIYDSGDKFHQNSRDGLVSSKIQQFIEIVSGNALTVSESAYLTEMAEQLESYESPE